jgi:hypothetical protein
MEPIAGRKVSTLGTGRSVAGHRGRDQRELIYA